MKQTTRRPTVRYKSRCLRSKHMEESGTVERREDGVWYWTVPGFKNPSLPKTIVNIPDWKIDSLTQ